MEKPWSTLLLKTDTPLDLFQSGQDHRCKQESCVGCTILVRDCHSWRVLCDTGISFHPGSCFRVLEPVRNLNSLSGVYLVSLNLQEAVKTQIPACSNCLHTGLVLQHREIQFPWLECYSTAPEDVWTQPGLFLWLCELRIQYSVLKWCVHIGLQTNHTANLILITATTFWLPGGSKK